MTNHKTNKVFKPVPVQGLVIKFWFSQIIPKVTPPQITSKVIGRGHNWLYNAINTLW